jgi:flavin-dependent thymidylate synthase
MGYYGGDQTHALSAWTSTFQESEVELPARIEHRTGILFNNIAGSKKNNHQDLLFMLAVDGHHTPFEKSLLHFQVICDDASHIHLLKHRIGVSINVESARYKELKEDRFYIPEDWPDKIKELLTTYSNMTNSLYHDVLAELTPILGRKRAKESARYFKLKNAQCVMDVSFNFRSFVHFQKLRNDTHAQKEIRDIARAMLDEVRLIPTSPFHYSLRAFGL